MDTNDEATRNLEMFIFKADDHLIQHAAVARVDSLIIDWERKGKDDRQTGYSTQIGKDTLEDLIHFRNQNFIPITVRIDGGISFDRDQLELAIDNGAGKIILPMSESVKQVEDFLNILDGRCQSIIQIETQDLINECSDLSTLPWDYCYIGLNDLMISREDNFLWNPLLDGTIDEIYNLLGHRKVGFGGITVMGAGKPLPFEMLLKEMSRLNCSLSFLRRSFFRDIKGKELQSEFKKIRKAWDTFNKRDDHEITKDHGEIQSLIKSISLSHV